MKLTKTKTLELISYAETLFAAGLSLRIILQLFNANQASSFVQFVYQVTNPLMQPFEGSFEAISVGSTTLDPAAVIGLILYPLGFQLLEKLVVIVFYN